MSFWCWLLSYDGNKYNFRFQVFCFNFTDFLFGLFVNIRWLGVGWIGRYL